ncbi:hypothetical protein RI578_06470 [Streptomyces sp. BB1-1-1]|uniref:hypothetical protein n=1 Tax=Streptomyces sp. BB1-1-1 TaxID=3074430 RepID=UPI002877349B|nr:hypothetical protein [Streptomyces sp. BB1-1-1]WND33957.1 hypothetical protein RI578_06470 [Streptomyces sp. BB1-1-1]
MAIKRCKSSFATSVRGVPRVMKVGALVNDDDPVLKGREHLFEDVEAAVREAPVEDASAAPGRRRSLTRAAVKRAAGKPARQAAAKPAKQAAPKAEPKPKSEPEQAGPKGADSEQEGTAS